MSFTFSYSFFLIGKIRIVDLPQALSDYHLSQGSGDRIMCELIMHIIVALNIKTSCCLS